MKLCKCLMLLNILATWRHHTYAVMPEMMGKNVDFANVQQYDSAAAISATLNENDFEQLLSEKLKNENSTEKLLSRKRRYLIFPEGSSFQLVWDGIIGVVDFTNYLILGITVALAWELPSKPPSEVLSDIEQRLADGTLGISRNDTITNITYVDTISTKQGTQYINIGQNNNIKNGKDSSIYYTNYRAPSVFRTPMHQKYYFYRPKDSYYSNKPYYRPLTKTNAYTNNQQKYGWRRKDSYYYTPKPNPFTKWTKTYQNQGSTAQSSAVKYPWWYLPTRLSNSRRKNSYTNSIPATSATSKSYYKTKNAKIQARNQKQNFLQFDSKARSQQRYSHRQARKHRIFPIFGKRSVSDDRNSYAASDSSTSSATHNTKHNTRQHNRKRRRSGIAGSELSKLDQIHIRHHRTTRHTLYEKIEKYLDKLKLNGHHCVLRALCETGQKSREKVPGTFIGELMRAVFTMPEALDEDLQKHRVPYIAQRYDEANSFEGSCMERYELCTNSLWQSHFVA
ncbi:uncharacterized protein LOC119675663 [Teleopsis dalmanni]|uniref:uncharacterized protein LOC119675663 n=1 Tax=Teleopsis dalmanni TaxID=139649 RepID=UPI0018CE3D2C|nr:uncharacterized protein LOC119675663 [Teleopsis dalmanni]